MPNVKRMIQDTNKADLAVTYGRLNTEELRAEFRRFQADYDSFLVELEVLVAELRRRGITTGKEH